MSSEKKKEEKKPYHYAFVYNENNKRHSQIDIRIYEDGEWEDKTNYTEWTNEEIQLYNNSKYGELMGMIEREEEEEEKEYYKVCCAENPDVDYFDTLDEAKAFCDKHADLDYGLIMLCDFEKNEIGDWGDYYEEEEEEN